MNLPKNADYFICQLFRASRNFICISRHLHSDLSSDFSWQKCHSASSLLSCYLEISWVWIVSTSQIRAGVATKPWTLVSSQAGPRQAFENYWKNQCIEDNNLSNRYCPLCNSCEWHRLRGYVATWTGTDFDTIPRGLAVYRVQPELINSLWTNPCLSK